MLRNLILLIPMIIPINSVFYDVNVCKEFKDYRNRHNNKNCFHNPDMFLEAPNLIEKYAGKVETYKFPTEDGYILTMFRIPRRNPKGTLLIHAPLTQDSKLFLTRGKKSEAVTLWNEGYDIWLANNRGTTFSARHKRLSDSDFAFWDFSFHEIGAYDIPSQLRVIRKYTNDSNVIFIGHSMGSTAALIYASLYPKDAKSLVRTFILTNPAVIFKHTTSFFKELAKLETTTFKSFVSDDLKIAKLIPVPLGPIGSLATRLFPRILEIVGLLISTLFGWTPEEVDPAFLNFDAGHTVKDFPIKIFWHYAQLMNNNEFRMYDYGKSKNLIMYNSEKPPLYPLEKISVPIVFISSVNDTLTPVEDTELLIDNYLSKNIKHKHVIVSGLNHADYSVGRHTDQILTRNLINIVNDIVSNG